MGELQDTARHLVVVGRGRVIADASVAELIAAASGGRVLVRTTAPARAMAVLRAASAEVADTCSGALLVSGLDAERAVVLLAGHAVPFSEVSAHRASLEEAYMELTRDAVEFRAVRAEGAVP
jgi:ABC-2 type transport system ATP-binding protein